MDKKEVLIEVKDLKKYFQVGRNQTLKAVDGVNFKIYKGETLGIVGESGCGKTTCGKTVMGLYKATGGEVLFDGVDINKLNKNEKKEFTKRAQIIFQDPYSSLNPRMTVFNILAEPLIAHGKFKRGPELAAYVKNLMARCGLPSYYCYRYPHQFSGGQRQRIGIARALIMNPDLIIADEAISALDVSIQAQVVNLMKKIQKETGIAYLFIAHDLSMVKYISDKIGVLHLGHLVETGTTEEIFDNPIHPYTKSLLSAIPHPNPRVEKVRKSFTYDYKESGVDYTKGTEHLVDGTHYVLATDEEFEKWTKK